MSRRRFGIERGLGGGVGPSQRAEITQFTFPDASSLPNPGGSSGTWEVSGIEPSFLSPGSAFLFTDRVLGDYYLYFIIDDIGDDPELSGTPIPCNILSTDDAAQIVTAMKLSITTATGLGTSGTNTLVITFSFGAGGNSMQDVSTGWSFDELTPGENAGAGPYFIFSDPVTGNWLPYFTRNGHGLNPNTPEPGVNNTYAVNILNSDTGSQIATKFKNASFLQGLNVSSSGAIATVTNNNRGAVADAGAGTMNGAGGGFSILIVQYGRL